MRTDNIGVLEQLRDETAILYEQECVVVDKERITAIEAGVTALKRDQAIRALAADILQEAHEWRGIDPINNRTARRLEAIASRLIDTVTP